MRKLGTAVGIALSLWAGHAGAQAQAPAGLGAFEFGMTQKQLVESIEKVEQLISRCMRDQGFEYFAADYETVHAGMKSDKHIRGMTEEEFINKYGYGVATMYTGQPPQLTTGYSPEKVGLGERNVQVFKSLPSPDQAAYNRALFGGGASFALALETENLHRTGGCTRKSIEQVFRPEQLESNYYNPQNALIRADPRMKAALRKYAAEMKKAGFDYTHPDDVEPEVRARLAAITSDGTVAVEKMSSEQRAQLAKLQDFERRVAATDYKLQEELITPVEERIQKELFARKVQ
jgi:hypothetical protein